MIGMQTFFANIDKVMTAPQDMQVRLNLLWASYYGGASISHSGTHLVHALSYPLGGKYRIPHGLANSLLLLPVMKFICVLGIFMLPSLSRLIFETLVVSLLFFALCLMQITKSQF